MKRIFDLFVSLLAVLLLFPLFFIIGLLIKLDSPGSIFYRGVRSGRGGVPFRMFKFRTMKAGSEKMPEGTTGLNDPRVTRVGVFLRKYKLDELPQLFNVVAGQMSLVGPRPELPRYTSQYSETERTILSVRPGITDYSSIAIASLDEIVGDKNVDHNFETLVLPRKNALRLQYVQTRTFWQDLRILFLTLWVILKKVSGQNRGWNPV